MWVVCPSCRERTGRVEFDPGVFRFEIRREGVRRLPTRSLDGKFCCLSPRAVSPDSTRNAVLLDGGLLRVDTEQVRMRETVFGRVYLQVGREIWIIHGDWRRKRSRVCVSWIHQDKVLFQFSRTRCVWGKASIPIAISGRRAEFESKTPLLFIIWGQPVAFSLSLLSILLAMANDRTDKVPHSKPMPINTTGGHHHRYRSASVSSDSSDGSPSDPIHTPLTANPPKVTTVSPSTSTSPFFSYIMGQQPTAKTLPFRRGTVDSIGSIGPVFDDGRSWTKNSGCPHANVPLDDTQEPCSAPLRKIHRRATTSWTAASPPQPMNPLAGDRHERASGLLRRLSLSTSSFAKVRDLQNFHEPV